MTTFRFLLITFIYFLIINDILAQTDTIPTIPDQAPQELEASEPEAFVEKTTYGESIYLRAAKKAINLLP